MKTFNVWKSRRNHCHRRRCCRRCYHRRCCLEMMDCQDGSIDFIRRHCLQLRSFDKRHLVDFTPLCTEGIYLSSCFNPVEMVDTNLTLDLTTRWWLSRDTGCFPRLFISCHRPKICSIYNKIPWCPAFF